MTFPILPLESSKFPHVVIDHVIPVKVSFRSNRPYLDAVWRHHCPKRGFYANGDFALAWEWITSRFPMVNKWLSLKRGCPVASQLFTFCLELIQVRSGGAVIGKILLFISMSSATVPSCLVFKCIECWYFTVSKSLRIDCLVSYLLLDLEKNINLLVSTVK